ncbi:MAG: hypothetical protein SFZ03_11000 [Candidatus Melainabacteria bacterium]|nr:hypothetical protein [Candidatus Melainabacteria bacterium]
MQSRFGALVRSNRSAIEQNPAIDSSMTELELVLQPDDFRSSKPEALAGRSAGDVIRLDTYAQLPVARPSIAAAATTPPGPLVLEGLTQFEGPPGADNNAVAITPPRLAFLVKTLRGQAGPIAVEEKLSVATGLLVQVAERWPRAEKPADVTPEQVTQFLTRLSVDERLAGQKLSLLLEALDNVAHSRSKALPVFFTDDPLARMGQHLDRLWSSVQNAFQNAVS